MTFDSARGAFQDPSALEWADNRRDYGEARFILLGLCPTRLLYVAYTMRVRRIRIISARGATPTEFQDYTVTTMVDDEKTDWSRFDAMTERDRYAAALDDPDAQPLTTEVVNQLRRSPRVGVIRRALHLSQEEFAARFGIPLDTLRDWEDSRQNPEPAAQAYLTVIGRDPDAVLKALNPAS